MPPAVSWSSPRRDAHASLFQEFGDCEPAGRPQDLMLLGPYFFPPWNTYDHSGSAFGIAIQSSVPRHTRFQSSFLTSPFAHISASGGEAGWWPSFEVVVFF